MNRARGSLEIKGLLANSACRAVRRQPFRRWPRNYTSAGTTAEHFLVCFQPAVPVVASACFARARLRELICALRNLQRKWTRKIGQVGIAKSRPEPNVPSKTHVSIVPS